MSDPDKLIWKEDWPWARRALTDWWAGKGLALHVTAPLDCPRERFPPVAAPADVTARWLDLDYRARKSLAYMSSTFHGGVAVPKFNTDLGPGSLGLMLGCKAHFAPDTVWYEPCISDPDAHPPLLFSKQDEWYQRHVALIERGRQLADGRFLIPCPDLIENIDTLAQLRGSQETLMDLVERPIWVRDRLHEINQAFSDCYDALYPLLLDAWGGTSFGAFHLWGVGKTVKVQCDFSCMISPQMFREFVVPPLREQCAWLDNAMYHLDGTQAFPQLENLLAIEELEAIEWTPQSGAPGGGSPQWYDLYRRIKSAGKSVQAVGVKPEEVLPLIDAVGAEGMFIWTTLKSEAEAIELLGKVGWGQ